MSTSFIRFTAAMLCLSMFLFAACFVVVSNAETKGSTIATSDMQLIGFMGPMKGGGHVHWEITGEAAQNLRANVIQRFDGNHNGIEDYELYPSGGKGSSREAYVNLVEYAIEGNEYMGASVRGAKPPNRDVEDDKGMSRDTSGLIGVSADSSEPIRISMLFDATTTHGDTKINLIPPIFGEAVYVPFSNGSFDGTERNAWEGAYAGPRDESGIGSLWHLTTDTELVNPGSSYPASWWCGDQDIGGYMNDMSDEMGFTVNLPMTQTTKLGFNTRLLMGAGDRGIVQLEDVAGQRITLAEYTSNMETWSYMEYDLSPYSGTVVTIRFLFEADRSGTALGWFVDDVAIFAYGPETIMEEDFDEGTQDWHLNGTWGVDNSTSLKGDFSLADSPGGNYTSNSTSNATYGPIDLEEYAGANLSLWYKTDLADPGDIFHIRFSHDNSSWTTVLSENETANWTQAAFPLDNFLDGELYISFVLESNETGEAGGVHIDDLVLSVEYPVLEIMDGEDDDFFTQNHIRRNLWRYTTQGTWICSDPETGGYPSSMMNSLAIGSVLDWRFAEEMVLSFDYRGSMGVGDRLVLEITTNPGANPTWQTLETITSGSENWETVSLSQELDSYLDRERIGLRFLFVSGNGGTGGIEVRDLQTTGTIYTGEYVISHKHYIVGTSSFHSPSVTQGDLFILRTPFGEILTYTVTLNAGEESGDSIQYSSFHMMENPQILFILFLIFSVMISQITRKFYIDYKASLPYRHRILAKKSALATSTSRVGILVLCILYFVPTLGNLFVSGLAFIFIGVILVVLSTVVSKSAYSSKKKKDAELMLEEEPKKQKVRPPRPAPAPAPPIINLHVGNKEKERKKVKKVMKPVAPQKPAGGKVVQWVNCAEIFEFPEDWHTEPRCPACGKIADKEEVDEKSMADILPRKEVLTYSATAECPECGALIASAPGAREDVDCPSCGEALIVTSRSIEPGYNYLLLGSDSDKGYMLFSSLAVGRNSLCLTTAFPDKVRREHPLESSKIVWITDTVSKSEEYVDPRRLDFEATRTINETTCSGDAVVFIDGIEFLIVENGFDTVLRFIKKITDISSMDEATLLLVIDPTSLGGDELSVLKREFDFVEDLDSILEDGDGEI